LIDFRLAFKQNWKCL